MIKEPSTEASSAPTDKGLNRKRKWKQKTNKKQQMKNLPFAPSRQTKMFHIERTQHSGVFLMNRRCESLITQSLIQEEATFEEKVFGGGGVSSSITLASRIGGKGPLNKESDKHHTEYRVWSRVFSPISGGLTRIEHSSRMQAGSIVLCMYPGIDTAPVHFSDIVGPKGSVYVIERGHKHAQSLHRYAKRRTNLNVIYGDNIDHLHSFLPMVDLIYCNNVISSSDDNQGDAESNDCSWIFLSEFEKTALMCLKEHGQCLIIFKRDQPQGLPTIFDVNQRIPLNSGSLLISAFYGATNEMGKRLPSGSQTGSKTSRDKMSNLEREHVMPDKLEQRVTPPLLSNFDLEQKECDRNRLKVEQPSIYNEQGYELEEGEIIDDDDD